MFASHLASNETLSAARFAFLHFWFSCECLKNWTHPQCSARYQVTGSSQALNADKESKRVLQERSGGTFQRSMETTVSATRSSATLGPGRKHPPYKPPPDRPPLGGGFLARSQRSVRHQATGSPQALNAAKESKRVPQDRPRCSSERTVNAIVSAICPASPDAEPLHAPPGAASSDASTTVHSGPGYRGRASPRCPSRTPRESSGGWHRVKVRGKPGTAGLRICTGSKGSRRRGEEDTRGSGRGRGDSRDRRDPSRIPRWG
jgi:hypothetical protein